MKRLIEQESCEHGKWEDHQVPVYRHDSCGYWKCSKCSVCPGGSIREVTVEALQKALDVVIDNLLPPEHRLAIDLEMLIALELDE